MLIDAHFHTFPVIRGVRLGVEEITSERYGMVRRKSRGLERFLPPGFEYTGYPIEVAVQYLQWGEIEKAVFFQSYVYGDHTDYYLEHVVPHANFRALALIDPRKQDAPKLVRHLISQGFVGILSLIHI